MNTIVDIVCEKLFKEIATEYKNYTELSDNILSTLNCIYGQPLLPALDLVDKQCVTRISSPNQSEIYQVVGNSGRVYNCSSSLQFCPCMSFQYGVINKKELITCKHILAIMLCKAMETCNQEVKTDRELQTFLFQQEY